MPEYYEIKVKGRLDPRRSKRFTEFKLKHLEGHEILLSGLLPDQVAIYGILERIHDLNLTLISVTCAGPSIHNSDKE